MLLDGTRCHRKTVLGTDFCFAHLVKYGIKEIPSYKSNHKSRVIDTISKIVCVGNFYENQKVFPIYGERLSPQQHIQRYQRYDRCGPQEFAFVKNHMAVMLVILILHKYPILLNLSNLVQMVIVILIMRKAQMNFG